MMKKTSSQPRKIRGRLYSAPLHRRQKLVAAHMSRELHSQYKRRSLPVHAGDKVKIMRGDFKGVVGKVEEVDLSGLKATIENVTQKRTDGKKVKVPVAPSNLMLLELNLDDSLRKRILARSSRPAKTRTEKPTVTVRHAGKPVDISPAAEPEGGRK